MLLLAAICGYVGLLPYLFEPFAKLLNVSMPLPVFVFILLLQAMILFGLVVGAGLLVGDKLILRRRCCATGYIPSNARFPRR